MLAKAHRLTSGESFRLAIRKGRRAGSRTVVVHLQVPSETGDHADNDQATTPVAGFVVSKAVGNAVIRNRVKRRLRHLAREHMPSLPGSAVLVVRALPPSSDATFEELGADLTRCLQRVLPA